MYKIFDMEESTYRELQIIEESPEQLAERLVLEKMQSQEGHWKEPNFEYKRRIERLVMENRAKLLAVFTPDKERNTSWGSPNLEREHKDLIFRKFEDEVFRNMMQIDYKSFDMDIGSKLIAETINDLWRSGKLQSREYANLAAISSIDAEKAKEIMTQLIYDYDPDLSDTLQGNIWVKDKHGVKFYYMPITRERVMVASAIGGLSLELWAAFKAFSEDPNFLKEIRDPAFLFKETTAPAFLGAILLILASVAGFVGRSPDRLEKAKEQAVKLESILPLFNRINNLINIRNKLSKFLKWQRTQGNPKWDKPDLPENLVNNICELGDFKISTRSVNESLACVEEELKICMVLLQKMLKGEHGRLSDANMEVSVESLSKDGESSKTRKLKEEIDLMERFVRKSLRPYFGGEMPVMVFDVDSPLEPAKLEPIMAEFEQEGEPAVVVKLRVADLEENPEREEEALGLENGVRVALDQPAGMTDDIDEMAEIEAERLLEIEANLKNTKQLKYE